MKGFVIELRVGRHDDLVEGKLLDEVCTQFMGKANRDFCEYCVPCSILCRYFYVDKLFAWR